MKTFGGALTRQCVRADCGMGRLEFGMPNNESKSAILPPLLQAGSSDSCFSMRTVACNRHKAAPHSEEEYLILSPGICPAADRWSRECDPLCCPTPAPGRAHAACVPKKRGQREGGGGRGEVGEEGGLGRERRKKVWRER